MKITKRQLRQIIKEEKAKLAEAQDPGFGFGIFNADYMYDLLVNEVENYLQSKEASRRPVGGLTKTEVDMLRRTLNIAVDAIAEDYEQ